jgi:transcriptional regulator with XRE-family HTH domain
MSTAFKIRQIRDLKKMSQEELANKIGVSQVTIGKWEQGTSIKHEYLKKLSETLEVPIDYLLEEKQININPHIENSTNNYVAFEISVKTPNEVFDKLYQMLEKLIEKVDKK